MTPNDLRILGSLKANHAETLTASHELGSHDLRSRSFSPARSPRAMGPRALVTGRSPSPPRIALAPAAPLLSGRGLAELPAPVWPPRLDFRYLGYGDAGSLAFGEGANNLFSGGASAADASRFDGLADHTYAPGPPIGGGGFVFGYAEPAADEGRFAKPRSRNRLRLATGTGGLDGRTDTVHPDSDPNAADDLPGPGSYVLPRWPEGPQLVGLAEIRGLAFGGRNVWPEDYDAASERLAAAPPWRADYEREAALSRFRSPQAGSGGFKFGSGHSRVAPEFRQLPRAQHERESRMANLRSRSAGPFRLLHPDTQKSQVHGRPRLHTGSRELLDPWA